VAPGKRGIGNMPECCPAVPGLNPASPQPTADCQSPGGLPPGMALVCGLTSVRGDHQKTYKRKLKSLTYCSFNEEILCLKGGSIFLFSLSNTTHNISIFKL
jgi:hypothetical protein